MRHLSCRPEHQDMTHTLGTWASPPPPPERRLVSSYAAEFFTSQVQTGLHMNPEL